MIRGIDPLPADPCRHVTLVPGDVVLTGTPRHSRPMAPGDVVEVEIDGLGRLSSTVAEGPAPAHALGHPPAGGKQPGRVAPGKDHHRMKNEGYGIGPRDYFDARGEFLRRSL